MIFFLQGCIKFRFYVFQVCWGGKKGEGNCKSVGKNIPRKNGIGKKYHLPVNIKATGKNIKLGTWEGALKIWEENQD